MAEAAGLTVGVVALAGLFNNSVQCFEYVELGRTFGKSYQTCQLKLDSARLRLSRWGCSIGLSGDLQEARSLEQHVDAQAIEQANELLGQVMELFAEAECISSKYQKRMTKDEAGRAVCSVQTDLDSAGSSLHSKMGHLALTHQNHTSLRQKAKWALYEEEAFRRLIEDIAELVANLTELFPDNQASQKDLCDEEVALIATDEESKHLLKKLQLSMTPYWKRRSSKLQTARMAPTTSFSPAVITPVSSWPITRGPSAVYGSEKRPPLRKTSWRLQSVQGLISLLDKYIAGSLLLFAAACLHQYVSETSGIRVKFWYSLRFIHPSGRASPQSDGERSTKTHPLDRCKSQSTTSLPSSSHLSLILHFTFQETLLLIPHQAQ